MDTAEHTPKSEHILVGWHLGCKIPLKKRLNKKSLCILLFFLFSPHIHLATKFCLPPRHCVGTLPFFCFLVFCCLFFLLVLPDIQQIIHHLAIVWVPRKKCASFSMSSIFWTQPCKINAGHMFKFFLQNGYQRMAGVLFISIVNLVKRGVEIEAKGSFAINLIVWSEVRALKYLHVS